MQHITQELAFTTTDLALATALSLEVRVESIDKSNPKRAVFAFSPSEFLYKLIEAYWRGEMSVEPQAYFNQLRVLKSRLYEIG